MLWDTDYGCRGLPLPGAPLDYSSFASIHVFAMSKRNGQSIALYETNTGPFEVCLFWPYSKTFHDKKFNGLIKKPLEMGRVARGFGGLLDREVAKTNLDDGLTFLAKRRGKKPLDKKEVPVLGISAPSEAGKTEFLKWVFNNCCTYLPGENKNAKSLLQKINDASPEGQEPLSDLLVLFASFSQGSTYFDDEGPIVATTVERFLRSFEGNIEMSKGGAGSWKSLRFGDFSEIEDIVLYFSQIGGRKKTGFIFCVDEISNLRHVARTIVPPMNMKS